MCKAQAVTPVSKPSVHDVDALRPKHGWLTGTHLAQLPMDAKVGKLLLLAACLGCLAPALTIAACLSHRSPFFSDLATQDAVARARAGLAASGRFPPCAMHGNSHMHAAWLTEQRWKCTSREAIQLAGCTIAGCVAQGASLAQATADRVLCAVRHAEPVCAPYLHHAAALPAALELLKASDTAFPADR